MAVTFSKGCSWEVPSFGVPIWVGFLTGKTEGLEIANGKASTTTRETIKDLILLTCAADNQALANHPLSALQRGS